MTACFPGCRRLFAVLVLLVVATTSNTFGDDHQNRDKVFPGADQRTPSLSQYFSWINNTNEGATEANTLANLDFFQWMHDEYGMILDIYAFDAGAIDGPRYYGSTETEKFKEQFPNGFDPIYKKAKAMGTRLGVWLGPDGFGNTPEEEKKRTDMLVGLCRDYEFLMFKVDAVCGQLRTEKQDAFKRMMIECRRHSPDLIVLNHRLNLGDALPYVTTKLWEGRETYIDVHMKNPFPATHNRAAAIARGLTPELDRLMEDCGVCISSCLDYWDDDLYMQAFSRNLILAPEIYGNPWLLRDDEYPKLARIYNLHRRYRNILVDGIALPEQQYGPGAVSRGDGDTRILALVNLTWEPIVRKVKLDESIGLTGKGPFEVRRFHPSEKIRGTFKKGEEVAVQVLPFRAYVMMATNKTSVEPGVKGVTYQLVRDVPGKPVELKLLGMPGTTAKVTLDTAGRTFKKATLDGNAVTGLLEGRTLEVEFPGNPLTKPFHRKLADLKPCDVPDDAEALYETTAYAATSNALEIQALERSGPTKVPQVKLCRDFFLKQPIFRERGPWDKFLFDGKVETQFAGNARGSREQGFHLDLGEPIEIDTLVFRGYGDPEKPELKFDPGELEVSADLKSWTAVPVVVDKTSAQARIPADKPVRYVRMKTKPGEDRIGEVEGYFAGKKLERQAWRASNRFHIYTDSPATHAWTATFTLDEAARGSYLCVPVYGYFGRQGCSVALRVDGQLVGAPTAAPAYDYNAWEAGRGGPTQDATFFIPVNEGMVGKPIQVVLLQMPPSKSERHPEDVVPGGLRSEIWITSYPIPFEEKMLALTE